MAGNRIFPEFLYISGGVACLRTATEYENAYNRSPDSLENLELKSYSKTDPVRVRRQISKKARAMHMLLYFFNKWRDKERENSRRLVFLTLTIPYDSLMSLKEQKKKIFLRFFENCQRENLLNSYIYRIEFQGNGRMHAHLIVDGYIDKWQLRKAWIKHLQRADQSIIAIDWQETDPMKNGLSNYPCTDIMAVKSYRTLVNYLSKYMGKAEDDKTEEGKKQSRLYSKMGGQIWGCSRNLVKIGSIPINVNAIENAMQWLTIGEDIKENHRRRVRRIDDEYYTLFLIDSAHIEFWYALLSESIDFCEVVKETYNTIYDIAM